MVNGVSLVVMLTVNLLLKLADKPNGMNVAHRQINNAIKTYMKNLKRLAWAGWEKRTVFEDHYRYQKKASKGCSGKDRRRRVAGLKETPSLLRVTIFSPINSLKTTKRFVSILR